MVSNVTQRKSTKNVPLHYTLTDSKNLGTYLTASYTAIMITIKKLMQYDTSYCSSRRSTIQQGYTKDVEATHLDGELYTVIHM